MKNRTVLFVDDDRIILKSLERTVQAEPYHSLFAPSGSKAQEVMAAEPVDLVVTDLMMPEMDGIQLLDWVQAEYPDTIRVVLSALSDTDSILEAINAGSVYRYIIKPWNREKLKITIRQALEWFKIKQEKKDLLSQLEMNNRLLKKRVEERAQQLLNIESQAKIGEHVSQIVHNLNTPLQAIFSTIDLIALKLSQKDPDLNYITGVLDWIKNSAIDLEKIVRSILLHVRSESVCEPCEVEVNSIIASVLEFFRFNPLFNKAIEKQIDLVEPSPIVFGNPVQIKQIVDNLISNAIDAMKESTPKQLSVSTRIRNRHVELTVADTGIGIDDSEIPKIFLPDFTTKPVGKGTGLGLASVKTMVEAFNGSVSVESKKGQGSTFSVLLPVAIASDPPAA